MSLNRAAKEGNIEEVKRLLSEKHDPNGYEDGYTPLLAMVVEHLLFQTPSKAVCMEITDLLLDAGANINAQDTYAQHRTVLHSAAELVNSELIEFFLKRGASVHTANFWKETPLHLAISRVSIMRKSKEQIIPAAKLLLDYGANPNRLNKMGYSCYSDAHDPEIEALLNQYNIRGEQSDSELFLSQVRKKYASLFNRQEIVQVKPLTELAAKAVIENKAFLFFQLRGVSDDLKKVYPELELDPMKRFIHKIDQLINRSLEGFKKETHPQELEFLARIKNALSEANPYNAVNLLIRELSKIMQVAYISDFTANMKPVKNQIVTMLKEYNSDKTFYAEQSKKCVK